MKALGTTIALFLISISLFSQEVEYIKMKSIKKPIVQADINGKKGYFLVDTGSDISIINTSDLKRYKLEEAKAYGDHRRAIGFNGGKTAVMKVKNARVIFGQKYDHSEFYSLNISEIIRTIEAKTNIKISGIMGSDLLAKYNCIIDYNQRHIILVDSRTKRKLAAR
ncbi:MAG: aspartyl protease family protein [Ekhidna sp.]